MVKYLAVALVLLFTAAFAYADVKIVQKVTAKTESDINPMANDTSEHK